MVSLFPAAGCIWPVVDARVLLDLRVDLASHFPKVHVPLHDFVPAGSDLGWPLLRRLFLLCCLLARFRSLLFPPLGLSFLGAVL